MAGFNRNTWSDREPAESHQGIRWLPVAFGVGLPWLVYLVIVWVGYDGPPVLKGDGYYYVSTAISVWQDQDLDLKNQLPGDLRGHSGHVSLDRRGRMVPKHPIFMPLASLPVLMLFGERGPLIFNVAQLMAIVALLYLLARRWAAPWSAAVAVAMTGAATILPHFAWNYSGDLFAVAAVLAGLVFWVGVGEIATQERVGPGALRAFGAGVLVGIGVISKLPFLVAPVAILVFIPSSRRRSAVCFGLGVLTMIALLCALNLHLFGDPWSTAYDRIAVFDDGVWRTEGVGQYFDLPILEGIQAQLFDGKHGLWTTSPITLLSYLMWPFLWRRSRGVALCLASVAGVLFLFFSRYELWHVSYYGNRFLLLPIVLGALPLAAALDRLLPWGSRPRCRPLGRSKQPEITAHRAPTERFQLPPPSPPATFEVCQRFASNASNRPPAARFRTVALEETALVSSMGHLSAWKDVSTKR